MVERWNPRLLEDRLIKPRLLSRSSTSVVYAMWDTVLDKEVVLKSYSASWSPQPALDKRGKQSNLLTVLSGSSYNSRPDRSYFFKETGLLEVLCNSKIVPPLLGIMPEHLVIIMDYVEGEAFSKKLLDVDKKALSEELSERLSPRDKEVKKNTLRERLLEHLVEFYNQTEDLSAKATRALIHEKKTEYTLRRYSVLSSGIGLRSLEEEDTRLRHYLLKLVYGGSEEFKLGHPEFYGVGNIPKNPDERKALWNVAKKEIKKYLLSKNIDFHDFVEKFKGLYGEIVSGEDNGSGKLRALSLVEQLEQKKLRIVHGDFGPHNVLYDPEKLGTILDFNECRVGYPHIDVSLALFNLYSNPRESRVPRLVEYFWNKQEGVKKAYPSFPDFLAGCIATRVMQSIRIASRNMDYESADVERFTEGHPAFEGYSSTKERDVRFKYDRIISLEETIPFYTIGDGNALLSGAHKARKEKLNEFLEMVRHLIHSTYIMPPLERYRGKGAEVLGRG